MFMNVPAITIQTKCMCFYCLFFICIKSVFHCIYIYKSLVFPPEMIDKPSVVVSGSRYTSTCNHLTLNVGSTQRNIGKSLYHKWNVYFDTFQYRETFIGSEFTFPIAKFETFSNIELVKIVLYSENWVCVFLCFYV